VCMCVCQKGVISLEIEIYICVCVDKNLAVVK